MDILNKSLLDLTGSFENELILGRTVLMNLGLGSGITPPIPPVPPTEPYYEVLSHITFAGGTSSGVYFDTGVIPKPNLKIDCTFRHNGVSNNTCVFGGRIATSGSDRKAFAFWDYVSGYMRADFANTSSGTSDIGQSADYDNTWVNVVYDKNKFYLDGTLKWTSSVATFTASDSACTITIGAMNSGTSTSSSRANFFKGDLQQFKIWDDDVLIRDYIPALDDKLIPCLYDRVNKTFTYSTITPTYTRWNKFDVDYIQNDANSYIKTGVIDENEDLSFEADFTYFSGSGYQYVLGAYGGDSYKNTVLYINSSNSIGAWVNKGYSQAAMLPNIVEANARIKCYADTTKSTINGLTTTTFVEGTARTGAELYVFRRNGDGSSTQPQTTSNAIIGLHSLKINIGNVIVRDFKPVVWHNGDTTAVACLYDEVYNKMHTNSGTGSLKAYIVGANDTVYEVGSNCSVSPATASQQVTNNYFNTGMYGNDKWNVKLIAFTSTNVAGQLFGNFVSSSATNNLTINSGTATGTGTISRFDGQAMSQDKIINMGANSKSLLQINKIGAWQDNKQIVAWSNPNSFTTSGTCYIGGTNGSATVRPNGCCYLVIDEEGTLVAEYIPVRNKTNTSQTGLYDRVSGTLNTGIGSHTFNSLS